MVIIVGESLKFEYISFTLSVSLCLNSVLSVKAVVAAFNQEKALVGAFSVITNLRMDLFEALFTTQHNIGEMILEAGPSRSYSWSWRLQYALHDQWTGACMRRRTAAAARGFDWK